MNTYFKKHLRTAASERNADCAILISPFSDIKTFSN